ncbi:hypothetical protein GINT2_000532 [Glugoides intestinalis]
MDWYEPGEDSYTFYDVLETEGIQGKLIVDLGCSTGILTDLLDTKNLVVSVDLNTKALMQLKEKNAVRTDLLKGITQEKVDVVVFNPPYVPDFDCSILGGGVDGREVIDRFISEIEVRCFYLLVIEANKPLEIMKAIREKGYQADVLKIRKVIGETIIIIKAILCR